MAINHQKIDVCKLLLQANADPFLVDFAQWWVPGMAVKRTLMLSSAAADSAWTKILSKCLDASQEKELRLLFSETECVERREFSILHKIVLRIINKDLEQELMASTADINSTDIIGRTPLSMAAEMNEITFTTLLLQYGAQPNLASNCGQTPLHYAASAKAPDCIPLLLNARAEVDYETDWNQTPLHLAAAYTKDKRHANILLDAGANPNKRDRDGISPLGWTAISNNPKVAACLLERGAVVNDFDRYGSSTLKQCIKSNRHEILRLLMPYQPRVKTCIADDESFFMLIAESADTETMDILKELDLKEVLIDVNSWTEHSRYTNILEKRSDASPALTATFEALMQVARAQQSEPDDLEEEVWEDALESLIV
jgi:ankyrin repeat protein